jgi:hypothetical protein
MFVRLIDLASVLLNYIDGDRRKSALALSDDDDACSICDYPFRTMNHMCIGAVTRVA